MAHSEKLSVTLFTTLPDIEKAQEISLQDHTVISIDDSCSDYEEPSYGPQQLNLSELNDLVLDLCLLKDYSEIHASRLQER